MKHLKNISSIVIESSKIEKENIERMEELLGIKIEYNQDSWTAFTSIFDYLISNFDDFNEIANSLEGEDFDKIDRIIQETADDSDFGFAYKLVENYLKDKGGTK